MQVDLKDRTAIITGAGGAIGGAMAIEFAKNGANVVIADFNEDTMNARVEEIRAMGLSAFGVKTDVTNRESAREMVAKTVEHFGHLEILVNNAGINGGPKYRKPIHEYDDDLWRRIMSVDLDGVYYCSKEAILQMEKQGKGGNIVNIASITGVTPLRLQIAFVAAKAGVINMSRAMAMELAPLNIRVNVIAPGSVLFEGTKELFYANKATSDGLLSHIPMHRPGSPEDIAGMACFLASDDASYVTGSLNIVDGGWTCGYTRDF